MDRNEILCPREYLRQMAEHHHLGVPVPAAFNGGGRDILGDALVNEQAGYWGSVALACCRSFTQKYPVQRILRDVHASRFTAGSTQAMRLMMERETFERLRDPAFRGEFDGDLVRGSPLSPEGAPAP